MVDPDMATDAAVAAAVELDEMDVRSVGIRCGDDWLAYMIFAASVASGEGWP